MKKYASIIALCLAIVLCFPAIPCYASEDSVQIKTFDSVDGFYSDTDMNNAQKYVTGYKSSNTNVNPSMSTLYGYLNSYEWDSSKDLYIIFISRYSDTLTVWEMDSELVGDAFSVVSPTSLPATIYPNNNYTMLTFFNLSRQVWYAGRSGTLSLNTQSPTWSYSNDGVFVGNNSGIYIRSDTQEEILDSNIPVYFNWDIVQKGGSAVTDSTKTFYSADKSSYINFLSTDLPYMDSEGSIVTPSSITFSDTAYNGGISFDYQQTHLYTEYNNAQGANETCVFKWALDSRSQSITQTTTDWKMHYYVIVNWHWTQATDSSVYTPLLSGGSGGQMAFEFDDVPEFIMQGKSKISIWDLVQNVPTVSSVRDEDIVSLAVAVSCLNGNIVNSVWKDIFGQSGQYVGDVASEIISGGKLEVQGVGEVGGSFINNLFNPAYYYALDDLRVNLVAHPWSETLAIHGGNGDFDLNLCTNVSYGTTQGYVDDGGTPDNPSDDMQYPTNTVPQQNNVVVPVTYPTSGGNVTVYSVVQVPDSGGGGGNSINYSPSFSPSIVMDSGLDDLKETVDAYPQVPNQHFWDYFLVFKDNAFLDATSDFFGALPNELSSLLISSIGIIGVFAIYRFVRRR